MHKKNGYSQLFTVLKDIFKFKKLLFVSLVTLIFVSGFEIYFPVVMKDMINDYIGGRIVKENGNSINVYMLKNQKQEDFFKSNGIEIIEVGNDKGVLFDSLKKLSKEERNSIRKIDIDSILTRIKLILVVLLFYIVIYFIHFFCVNYIAQTVMFGLREDVFDFLLNFNMSYYTKVPAGVLVTRVINDVEAISKFFAGVVLTWIKDIVLFTGVAYMMYKINSELFMIFFIIIPVLSILIYFYQFKLRDAYRGIRTQVARLNAFLSETFSGIFVIKAFSKEEESNERFSKLNLDVKNAYLKQIMLSATFMPAISVIRFVSVAIVLIVGGQKILESKMLFGDLVAFFTYIEMIFRPVRDMVEKFTLLQSAQAGLEKVFSILNDKKSIEHKGGNEGVVFENGIEFKDVCFSYVKDKMVLKDINLRVNRGEKVAFVGHTGAGKTSIINLITGFYKKDSGDILIDGKRIEDIELDKLREKLAYVPQDVFIFSESIGYNLNFSVDNAGRLNKVIDSVRLSEFIEKHDDGIDTVMQERGNSLSYGEKQLLAFGRALYFDPEIIVLDEATSNIDSETEALVQDALDELLDGRTAFIIAHRLSTIKHCDRIFVLNKGRIVEEGTHDELLEKNGHYKKLYELQYSKF